MAHSEVQELTNYLVERKEQIQMVLPNNIDVNRILRIVATEIKRTPTLLQCDRASLFGAILQCCQLGLEPGNTLGQAYLVPYGKTCQLIIGYRGLIELARRSGMVTRISAHSVYEHDEFYFEYGSEEKIKHVPAEGERGHFKAVYAIAYFSNNTYQIALLSLDDIHKIRERSGKKLSKAWETDFAEMAKKTVIRRLCKYLPLGSNMQQAIVLDEMVETQIPQKNEAWVETIDEPKTKANQLNQQLQQLTQEQ